MPIFLWQYRRHSIVTLYSCGLCHLVSSNKAISFVQERKLANCGRWKNHHHIFTKFSLFPTYPRTHQTVRRAVGIGGRGAIPHHVLADIFRYVNPISNRGKIMPPPWIFIPSYDPEQSGAGRPATLKNSWTNNAESSQDFEWKGQLPFHQTDSIEKMSKGKDPKNLHHCRQRVHNFSCGVWIQFR